MIKRKLSISSRGGFTLLELMLVLLLVSLVVSVSAPSLWRSISAAEQRTMIERVHLYLVSQPRLAVEQGRENVLTAQVLRDVIDQGYVVRMQQPIVYGYNGMNNGGFVELISGDGLTIAEFIVESPTGKVQIVSPITN